MPNIVITGAASGLGRALVLLYASAAEDSTHIYAVDAHYPSADVAKTMSGSSKPDKWIQQHVHQYTVDVTVPDEVSGFGTLLDMDEKPIDLLIHCAGIRGLVPGQPINEPADTLKAETFSVMDKATMEKTFSVNTVGAFLFFQTCVPGLRRAAAGGGPPPKAMVLGSRMGSIADNKTGGSFAYRASKAALNAVVKSFSIDVPEAIWAVLHPSVVKTQLVPEVTEVGAQDPMDAAAMLVDVIKGLEKKDSGRFLDRFGEDIAW